MFTTIDDPLYESVVLLNPVKLVLNSPEVQRLRDLRQTGVVSYVYPSSIQNRFGHSVGCMHLALEFLRAIEENHLNLNITLYEVGEQYYASQSSRDGEAATSHPPTSTLPPPPPHKRTNGEADNEWPPTCKRQRQDHHAAPVEVVECDGESPKDPSSHCGPDAFLSAEDEAWNERAGRITQQDRYCVAIAGLCHDLGHGPLSHTFESVMNQDWRDTVLEVLGKRRKKKERQEAREQTSTTTTTPPLHAAGKAGGPKKGISRVFRSSQRADVARERSREEEIKKEEGASRTPPPRSPPLLPTHGVRHANATPPPSNAFPASTKPTRETTSPLPAHHDKKKEKEEEDVWSHEEMSLALLDRIWKRLERVFRSEYSLTEHDHAFVRLLMTGLRPKEPFPCLDVGRPAWKRFMVDIVANKVNGMDVDKLDYLRRDGLYTGHQGNFEVSRIFQNAFVVPVAPKVDPTPWTTYADTPSGQYRICYAEKLRADMQHIFNFRQEMHKLVYQHRVVILTGRMVKDVLSMCGKVRCIRKECTSAEEKEEMDEEEEEEELEEEEGALFDGPPGSSPSFREGGGKWDVMSGGEWHLGSRGKSSSLDYLLSTPGSRRRHVAARTSVFYTLPEAAMTPAIFALTNDGVLEFFRHMNADTVPLRLPSPWPPIVSSHGAGGAPRPTGFLPYLGEAVERHRLHAAQTILARLNARDTYGFLRAIYCETKEEIERASAKYLLPALHKKLQDEHPTIWARLQQWEKDHAGLPALCSELVPFSLATKECKSAVDLKALTREKKHKRNTTTKEKKDDDDDDDEEEDEEEEEEGFTLELLHPKDIITYVNPRKFVAACRPPSQTNRTKDTNPDLRFSSTDSTNMGEEFITDAEKRKQLEKKRMTSSRSTTTNFLNNCGPRQVESVVSENIVYWLHRLNRPQLLDLDSAPYCTAHLADAMAKEEEEEEGTEESFSKGVPSKKEAKTRRDAPRAGILTANEERTLQEVLEEVFNASEKAVFPKKTSKMSSSKHKKKKKEEEEEGGKRNGDGTREAPREKIMAHEEEDEEEEEAGRCIASSGSGHSPSPFRPVELRLPSFPSKRESSEEGARRSGSLVPTYREGRAEEPHRKLKPLPTQSRIFGRCNSVEED